MIKVHDKIRTYRERNEPIRSLACQTPESVEQPPSEDV
jgi:hypothetical protein